MNRLRADIESIIKDSSMFFPLANATVLITGATGLIGSMLMRTIYAANEKYRLNINLIGMIRNSEKAQEVFGDLYRQLRFVKTLDDSYNYIIHTVSPTTSKFFMEYPVETIKSSVKSTMEILEVAKASGASLVYLSSMEQYGVPCEQEQVMTEDKIGVIDHLNIRSSYSESKRLCECLCASYAEEYGVHVKIARLAQTFGAGISSTDNRMPMQFARAAADGKDIVLHTEGKSYSNFVYLTDALTGILTILEKGGKGQAYNICNDTETRTVREIAELVCDQVARGKTKVMLDIKDNMGYAPDVKMYLNSDKLRNLGWKAEVGMVEAYKRLSEYLEDNQNDLVKDYLGL